MKAHKANQAAESTAPQVVVSRDRCVAELVIPPAAARESLTLRRCLDAVEAKSIPVDQDLIERLRDGLRNVSPLGTECRIEIAAGNSAVDGDDGRIQWQVSCGYEPPSDSETRVDHYDRASLPLVTADKVIAYIEPPTAGVKGRDVFGRAIEPKPGKPATLRHDETIRTEGDAVIANAGGILEVKAGAAHIREMIDIRGNVDFSTGHVEYGKDVRVRGGVFDRFRVDVGGHLVIEGLTEAADIRTGGDFAARGGMVGYPNGKVAIEGNMTARYLDSVAGHIRGNLDVEREIIHCTLTVTGTLDVSTGAIIGGEITAKGPVHVGTLGSGAGVATTLNAKAMGDALQIHVVRKLQPGVVLKAGAQRFYFNQAIRGPLTITRDENGILVLTRGSGEPKPLALVESVR